MEGKKNSEPAFDVHNVKDMHKILIEFCFGDPDG